MRALATAQKVRQFMEAIGHEARGPGRIYLTGGATAVLHGWREATVDIDLKMDPEPPGVFEAIRHLKEDLDVNVELAAPDQFIPPLPGWQERSRSIGRCGEVEFLHYDPYAQALSKLERRHARDLDDVRCMAEQGLIERERLRELFEAIRSDLIRYPSVEEDALAEAVEEFVRETK